MGVYRRFLRAIQQYASRGNDRAWQQRHAMKTLEDMFDYGVLSELGWKQLYRLMRDQMPTPSFYPFFDIEGRARVHIPAQGGEPAVDVSAEQWHTWCLLAKNLPTGGTPLVVSIDPTNRAQWS